MTTFDINNIVDNAIRPKIDVWAIYLRKSRADFEAEKNGEGETLARHKKILTDVAARKGLYVGKIYEEIVSGETIEARPVIQELIRDCYLGKYKGILIVEVTRLSRGNSGDAQTIMDVLKYGNNNKGMLVVTPTKTYDVVNSPEDEEYMEFELFMSRREFKMIRKRMERGKLQSVVEGNYIASARPYGYNILKTKTSRTLIPHPQEAPIVKKIFEWATKDNLTPYAIARRLTAMEIPTYKNDKDWSRGTITDMLLNPVYAGKIRWNEKMKVKRMIDGELKTVIARTTDPEQILIFEGKHKKDALVDEETFNNISTKYARDKTKEGCKLKNPLATVLVCKKCGKTLYYQAFNTRPNTATRYTHREGKICKVKSVKYDDVIDAVIHGLKLYIEDLSVKVERIPDVNPAEIEVQIEAYNKEIRKIEKKLDKLFDAWEDEEITPNEFVQRKAIHNDRIENIKNQIEQLEEVIPEKEDMEDTVVRLHEAIEALRDESKDPVLRNEYVKNVVEKIEFSRENEKEFILDITLH